MNLLRPFVILAVIAAAIAFSAKHAPHHAGTNPFETLYMHLVPTRLIATSEAEEHASEPGGHAALTGGHGVGSDGHSGEAAPHYLLSIELPGFLALFDMDAERAGAQLVLTNLQIFQIAAALLIFVCFLGVPRYLRTGRGDFASRLFAGFALWIREEMVYPVMGKEAGRQFLPFFLILFFFVLFMNLLGLLPGSATATASIFVTGAMALVTLGSMLVCGMVAQGPIGYWKNLVPHVPAALWPLMFVVELIGVFIKPFALMIRLFANMSGGHLVVLSLMGMIFTIGAMGPAVGWAAAPISVGFAVFIMIIEFFVAMLQAYIFTMLSILFVQASVHPEH